MKKVRYNEFSMTFDSFGDFEKFRKFFEDVHHKVKGENETRLIDSILPGRYIYKSHNKYYEGNM